MVRHRVVSEPRSISNRPIPRKRNSRPFPDKRHATTTTNNSHRMESTAAFAAAPAAPAAAAPPPAATAPVPFIPPKSSYSFKSLYQNCRKTSEPQKKSKRRWGEPIMGHHHEVKHSHNNPAVSKEIHHHHHHQHLHLQHQNPSQSQSKSPRPYSPRISGISCNMNSGAVLFFDNIAPEASRDDFLEHLTRNVAPAGNSGGKRSNSSNSNSNSNSNTTTTTNNTSKHPNWTRGLRVVNIDYELSKSGSKHRAFVEFDTREEAMRAEQQIKTFFRGRHFDMELNNFPSPSMTAKAPAVAFATPPASPSPSPCPRPSPRRTERDPKINNNNNNNNNSSSSSSNYSARRVVTVTALAASVANEKTLLAPSLLTTSPNNYNVSKRRKLQQQPSSYLSNNNNNNNQNKTSSVSNSQMGGGGAKHPEHQHEKVRRVNHSIAPSTATAGSARGKDSNRQPQQPSLLPNNNSNNSNNSNNNSNNHQTSVLKSQMGGDATHPELRRANHSIAAAAAVAAAAGATGVVAACHPSHLPINQNHASVLNSQMGGDATHPECQREVGRGNHSIALSAATVATTTATATAGAAARRKDSNNQPRRTTASDEYRGNKDHESDSHHEARSTTEPTNKPPNRRHSNTSTIADIQTRTNNHSVLAGSGSGSGSGHRHHHRRRNSSSIYQHLNPHLDGSVPLEDSELRSNGFQPYTCIRPITITSGPVECSNSRDNEKYQDNSATQDPERSKHNASRVGVEQRRNRHEESTNSNQCTIRHTEKSSTSASASAQVEDDKQTDQTETRELESAFEKEKKRLECRIDELRFQCERSKGEAESWKSKYDTSHAIFSERTGSTRKVFTEEALPKTRETDDAKSRFSRDLQNEQQTVSSLSSEVKESGSGKLEKLVAEHATKSASQQEKILALEKELENERLAHEREIAGLQKTNASEKVRLEILEDLLKKTKADLGDRNSLHQKWRDEMVRKHKDELEKVKSAAATAAYYQSDLKWKDRLDNEIRKLEAENQIREEDVLRKHKQELEQAKSAAAAAARNESDLRWEDRLANEARDLEVANQKWKEGILQAHREELEDARSTALAGAARDIEVLRNNLEQSQNEVETLLQQAREQAKAGQNWRDDMLRQLELEWEKARSTAAAAAAAASTVSLSMPSPSSHSPQAARSSPTTLKSRAIAIGLQQELDEKTKECSKLQENFNKIAMQNSKHSDTIDELRQHIDELKDRFRCALGGPAMPLKIED